jgi:hypothetical protein
VSTPFGDLCSKLCFDCCFYVHVHFTRVCAKLDVFKAVVQNLTFSRRLLAGRAAVRSGSQLRTYGRNPRPSSA